MNVSISQAMACGLPVIATRHSGFPDQILDGITGLIIPEGDWEALAQAIYELIEHPDRWGFMGRAGREHVEKKYDNAAILDEQVKLYNELINH